MKEERKQAIDEILGLKGSLKEKLSDQNIQEYLLQRQDSYPNYFNNQSLATSIRNFSRIEDIEVVNHLVKHQLSRKEPKSRKEEEKM